MSLASELAVFEALLGHLGVERCSLVGMSCGGCTAAAFTARHPERVDAPAMFRAELR